MTETDAQDIRPGTATMSVPLWVVARVAAFAAALWFNAPIAAWILALWTAFDGGYLARGWLDRRRAARKVARL